MQGLYTWRTYKLIGNTRTQLIQYISLLFREEHAACPSDSSIHKLFFFLPLHKVFNIVYLSWLLPIQSGQLQPEHQTLLNYLQNILFLYKLLHAKGYTTHPPPFITLEILSTKIAQTIYRLFNASQTLLYIETVSAWWVLPPTRRAFCEEKGIGIDGP